MLGEETVQLIGESCIGKQQVEQAESTGWDIYLKQRLRNVLKDGFCRPLRLPILTFSITVPPFKDSAPFKKEHKNLSVLISASMSCFFEQDVCKAKEGTMAKWISLVRLLPSRWSLEIS